jgi:hypothetical protein
MWSFWMVRICTGFVHVCLYLYPLFIFFGIRSTYEKPTCYWQTLSDIFYRLHLTYDMFVLITSRSLPHSWRITWFVARVWSAW